MSGIINALFGHHKDKDEKKSSDKKETNKSSASSSSGSSIAHTAISDDVRVQSIVSTESNTNVTMQNSNKMTDLINKLATTHKQVDEYSKVRHAQISEAVSASIEKVVAETGAQQQKLLSDANERSMAIENDYKQRLEERIAQLDNEKAVLLAELERNLNERQETILLEAKKKIDQIENEANMKKMAILQEAQSQTHDRINQITEQVAELAAEDAQRRLQTTTQTVITTKAVASGETHH